MNPTYKHYVSDTGLNRVKRPQQTIDLNSFLKFLLHIISTKIFKLVSITPNKTDMS